MIPPEKATEFLFSTTTRCANGDNARAVVAALLTMRYQPNDYTPLRDFCLFVLQNLVPFREMIIACFCEVVRKDFETLTKEAQNNTLNIFTVLCTVGDKQFLIGLAVALVSNYDTGCLTSLNLKLIDFLTNNIRMYSALWCELDNANMLVVLKLLRFYQDMFVLQDCQQSQPIDKAFKDILRHAATIGDGFTPDFVGFFQQSLVNIIRHGIREVIRILYDPRTCRRMKGKFPALYTIIGNLKEDDVTIFHATLPSVLQVMLPYPRLCSLLEYNRTYRNEPCPAFRMLMDRPTPLRDIDLILSDIIRTLIQSPDYDQMRGDDKYRTLTSLFKRTLGQAQEPPRSCVQALINDALYIRPQLFSDVQYGRKTFNLLIPLMFFLRDKYFGKLIADAFYERLNNDDHPKFKKTSFREIFPFMKRSNADLAEALFSIQGLDPGKREALMSMMKPKEVDIVPPVLVEFHRNNGTIDSPQGLQVLQLVSTKITEQIDHNQAKLANAVPNILRLMELLIPKDRNGIGTVFDRVDTMASAVFCSQRVDDARMFLEWCATNRDVSAFVNNYDIIRDMSGFIEVICTWIAERRGSWMFFVKECNVFRNSVAVVHAICDFCPLSTLLELAEMPILPSHSGFYSQLFGDVRSWSPDAQMKLTKLFSGRLTSPSAFGLLSNVFAQVFHLIPPIILAFFEEEFMMVQCSAVMRLLDEIRRIDAPECAEFCKRVRDGWSVSVPTKQAPLHLLEDTTIL